MEVEGSTNPSPIPNLAFKYSGPDFRFYRFMPPYKGFFI